MDTHISTAIPANGLPWTQSLHTGDARMDETHKEFTDMLNEILATPQGGGFSVPSRTAL